MSDLGWQGRDEVTGFTGTVLGRAEYLYTTTELLVVARSGQGSNDSRWLAVERVERLDERPAGFARGADDQEVRHG